MVNKIEQRGQASVFISYAREDRSFALDLAKSLEARGVEAKGDWLLTTGDDYAKRLREFNLGAHAFIFIISPDSIRSRACRDELALAAEHKKQILPVSWRDHHDDDLLDSSLRSPQWTFLREGDDVERGITALVKAINTDFALMDMHGRLLVAADNWQNHGRNRSYLLRRDALKNAEGWLAMTGAQPDKLPQPTPLEAEFIVASQRARSRGTQIGFAVIIAIILVLTIASIVAWTQRAQAVSNAEEARRQTEEAERQKKSAEENAEEAKRQQRIAEDRQLAAQAAQFDATASQMFAESRRVEAQLELERKRSLQLDEELEITELENHGTGNERGLRLQNLKGEIAQTEQEMQALEARAREYRRSGAAMLRQAEQTWSALQARNSNWTGNRQQVTVPSLFSLEILDATEETGAALAECMILHYGDPDRPNFIVIGGGMRSFFKNILEPRFAELRKRWGRSGVLHIDTVIASHLDVQSSEGLLALTESMLDDQQSGRPPQYTIGTFWYNSFRPLNPKWAKARLALNLEILGIRQNMPFDHFVMRPDSGAVRLAKGSLQITVIGPDSRRLEELGKYWFKEAKRRAERIDTDEDDPDVASHIESYVEPVPTRIPEEKFSSASFVRLRAPVTRLSNSALRGFRENRITAPNLASIAAVFELHGKRILYAGDAAGSDILKGLHAAGYLSIEGTTHVDLMIVPHFGSDLNVTKDFFRRVAADHYVLLGDGSHKNPEVATLKMIEEARADAAITLYFANRDGRDDHGTKLDQYFRETVGWQKRHRRVFRRFDEPHMQINLFEPVRY